MSWMLTDVVPSHVEKCKGINSIIVVNDLTFTLRVVIRPHRSYYQQLDSDSSASDDDQPSSDNLWRAVINDIREKSGNVHSPLRRQTCVFHHRSHRCGSR